MVLVLVLGIFNVCNVYVCQYKQLHMGAVQTL